MNLLLLEPADYVARDPHIARVHDRRLVHVRKILRAAVGDDLVVGELGGLIGSGRITRLDRDALELEVQLERPPPPRLAVSLVLALPRPPVLRRCIAAAASLGVAMPA